MADDPQPVAHSKVCPFKREYQLNHSLVKNGKEREPSKKTEKVKVEVEDLGIATGKTPAEGMEYLPGHPRIKLNNTAALFKFLEREFCNTDIDLVADKLWWMSKQDKRSISPLHRQKVKKREIILTEDSKMHLVWINDRIHIKPLPKFMISYDFWETYLGPSIAGVEPTQKRIRKAALGYIRTWLYLVKYESDFDIAIDQCLIPGGIKWEQFCNFTSEFEEIPDGDVHGRYAYGEIRLTRLNLYAPITIRKQHFQRVTYQYGEYFSQFYGPLLFCFGVPSVVLSALQVAIAVDSISPVGNAVVLAKASLWFAVVTVLGMVIVTSSLVFLWVYKVVKEWKYALRDKYGKPAKARPGQIAARDHSLPR
jgi:hypothetical protein